MVFLLSFPTCRGSPVAARSFQDEPANRYFFSTIQTFWKKAGNPCSWR
jgi:hypothetical protein